MRSAAAFALVLAACAGGRARAPRSPEAVRLELAEDPTDGDLHRELARALARAGRPGGALRHFEEARRRGDLEAEDRRALAELYARRAAARVSLGDGEAWRDAERAAGMGRRVDPRVVREGQLLAALAGFRRGDRPGRARAVDMLRRALRRQPRDFLRVLVDPRAPGADLMSLARAGRWLDDGGARRVALETYERYVDGGGRVAEHVRRYLVLFRWWHGDRERPSGLLLADAQAAGIDTAPPQMNHQDTKNTKNTLGVLRVLVANPRDVEAIRNAYRRDPARADRL
ncbi:MAG TPA: hypothetical protein VMZ28_09325, partial [Kofleriaceae bacterium]|nr:hypothetical protein [Kofleriaceae bacterium]